MTRAAVVRTLWCAAGAVFVVAVVGPQWRSGFPPVYPDSHSYLAVASRNPWSPKFWADQRPPTYPLFVWLFGSSPAWIVVAQTLCWVAAWAWLLATAWRSIAHRVVAGAAVAVLALIAIESRWAFWSTQILTESLSGSLAVAGVAAWWRWLAEPTRRRTRVAIAVTAAWMLVRDSNAVSLLAVAVPATAVAVAVVRRPERRGPRRRAALLALGAVLVVGAVSLGTQVLGERNEAAFHNNMGLRWLRSETMRDYFGDHGLPISDALDARIGKDAWADGEAFLTSPELDEYRDWADGRGRFWAAWSLVGRAAWYLDGFRSEVGWHTGTDFAEYDSYRVGDQLPDRPLWVADPSGSGWAMLVWGAVVVGLGAAAVTVHGRRREAWFVAALGAPVLADLYLSYAGDAVEVGRHLSGGLLRYSVVAVVAAAVFADALLRPAAVPATRARRGAWLAPATWVTLATLAAIAVGRMTTSAADFDPQFMRVVVERTVRFGGGYYENAIHNKGPLEPFVYELAARLGGRDGFWFVIAVFALGAALCVGAAAAVVATRVGAARPVAYAAAAAVVAHLTLSESDYAGVLYARNMAVALLTVAVVVALLERCWTSGRRRRLAVVAIGAATGLAVQTMLTTAFTATPVLVFAMWRRRGERVAGRPAWAWLPAVSALAFSSALVWYGVADLLGVRSFGAFVDGWWRYARFMSEATGRGPGGQASLAWERAQEYYGDRPLVAVLVVAWAVVALVRWRDRQPGERGLIALLATWFVGAWVELAVSQRYSSHYFSVLAVPCLLMAAQLTGWATAPWRERLGALRVAVALPLVAALATIQAGGTEPFGEGIETASTIHSFGALDRRVDAGRGGRIHFERSVLSVFSEPGDPLLAWTSYPWVYLDRHRVSATRYIWKEFLLGEIYLGGRSADFVLPGTWDTWEADLVDSNPIGYLVEAVNPVEPGTPFERVVAERFTTVHRNPDATLALRDDLAAWLRDRPTGAVAATGGRLAEYGCVRVDGTLGVGQTQFTLGDASLRVYLDEDGGGIAESHRQGVSGFQVAVAPGSTDFTLVAGARATLLMVGGDVVAAVERGGVPIDADGALGAYTTSAVHPLSGC